jgi:hypothetical protein
MEHSMNGRRFALALAAVAFVGLSGCVSGPNVERGPLGTSFIPLDQIEWEERGYTSYEVQLIEQAAKEGKGSQAWYAMPEELRDRVEQSQLAASAGRTVRETRQGIADRIAPK